MGELAGILILGGVLSAIWGAIVGWRGIHWTSLVWFIFCVCLMPFGGIGVIVLVISIPFWLGSYVCAVVGVALAGKLPRRQYSPAALAQLAADMATDTLPVASPPAASAPGL